MAISYNPRTITDGLVLCLDAGNNKSHSSNRFISYGTGETTQNVTFQVNGTGTFQRVAAGIAIGGYIVKRNDVVYSYALGGTGCHYHGNDIPIPAGVRATFSFDYLVTGASNYPTANYLANFEIALSGSTATANNLQDVWQRRTFTAGPTSSAGTLRALLYPGACSSSYLASSGTLYYKNPRVEFTNVDTGTENFSSMPNLTTWSDLSGNGNNGTLTNNPYHFIETNGDKGYMSFDGTDDYISTPITGTFSQITFEFYGFFDDPNLNMLLREESAFGDWTSNRVHFGTRWTGSNAGMHFNVNGVWQTTPPTYLRYGWNHYVLVYDTVNNLKRVYLNGILSSSHGTNGNMVLGDFRIGVATNLNRYYRGNISNFKVYNRALTPQEIQQNFNATRSRFSI